MKEKNRCVWSKGENKREKKEEGEGGQKCADTGLVCVCVCACAPPLPLLFRVARGVGGFSPQAGGREGDRGHTAPTVRDEQTEKGERQRLTRGIDETTTTTKEEEERGKGRREVKSPIQERGGSYINVIQNI